MARRRNKKEQTAFFSQKMKWLSERCAWPSITDHQFRLLYSLIVDFLWNDSGNCRPLDETLGAAIAKSGRTVRRLAHELEDAGVLTKRKTLRESEYEFDGLETRPATHGQSENVPTETRPANLGTKTGHVAYQDRPQRGRTESSSLPHSLPLTGEASPSPCNSTASASQEKQKSSPGGSQLNNPANPQTSEQDMTPEEKTMSVRAKAAIARGLFKSHVGFGPRPRKLDPDAAKRVNEYLVAHPELLECMTEDIEERAIEAETRKRGDGFWHL
jgi:hypothetical protein